MDIEIFLGRFHPLVIHLPIGFIVMGTLMYVWSRLKKLDNAHRFISFSFMLGFLSAVVSVAVGWLLAADGLHDGASLDWHRWLGVAVMIVSGIVWALFQFGRNIKEPIPAISLIVVIVLIAFTGHFGGQITHGETYLTDYGPKSLKKILGHENSLLFTPNSKDSIVVFEHLIKPILVEKCFSCHNGKHRNGGLDLMNLEHYADTVDISEWIVPGEANESSLFKRVSIDPKNRKFMPPNGIALSYHEIQLLEWWIEQGANFKDTLANYDVPKDIAFYLSEEKQIDIKEKPLYERITIDHANPDTLKHLKALGFKLRPLSSESPFLEVVYRRELTDEHLKALESISQQIIILDLADCSLDGEWLKPLKEFKYLMRLKLNGTSVKDEQIEFLAELNHLESINLYATEITNAIFPVIASLKHLKSVYLWKTNVTQQAASAFQQEHPGVRVNLGAVF